jgi:asparagine synthase (glutamine-hydrolysing)
MLWGWASLDGSDMPAGALEAMLTAEGHGESATILNFGDTGQIATNGTAAWLIEDTTAGCIAAVVGRPRWSNAALAAIASDRGHAAALLERYHLVGEAALTDLQGSFALVLIDVPRKRVLLAVDRVGIERLCFARRGPLLVFSTSATAVARHPAVQASVSQQALYEYLYCHMVPSPDTVFTGVEKLLPAQQLMATPGGTTRSFYWALQFSPDTATPPVEQQATFKALLRQAVTRQLDQRPTGAFLSGGTDSSTVAGLLGDVSGQATPTFSIGFDAEGFDELEYARITARHFGTRAHEFYVTPQHVAEAMPFIAAAYDEPFGNASAVPTYFCARLAREHGIEVMLAGDGGDEFFGGNVRYAKQGVFEHYWKLPGLVRHTLETVLLKAPLGSAPAPLRKAQSYIRQARVPLPDRLESYNFLHREPLGAIFDPAFLAAVDLDRPLELMRETYARASSEDPVDRMMHLDHKFTLADNDLRKVGRMCEAAGIDVRFPLLDEDLMAFSGTLTGPQKVAHGRLRVFFKDALQDYLPKETISKSKHGFGLPFGIWLKQDGALREQTQAALQNFAQRGIVRGDYLTRLWRDHQTSHASYYGVMLWVLTQLELWLVQHADGDRRQVT